LLLTVSWTLVSIVIMLSSQNLREAVQLCIMGMVLLLVFWSRHIHAYRRLTEPLTALWGTLFAGLAIFGVSKGVAFYTLAVLPLGLFMLPLIETSISVVSAAFSPMPTGNLILYRKLLSRGMDHASRGHSVVMICAFIDAWPPSSRSGSQLLRPPCRRVSPLDSLMDLLQVRFESDRSQARKPGPLGIRVDKHITKLCYQPGTALDKQRYRPLHNRHSRCSRGTQEQDGHEVQEDNQECPPWLLPDGPDLLQPSDSCILPSRRGYPASSSPKHICKRASYEGWGIWFLGGAPGGAEAAAAKLAEKYPGLNVAGTRNGYFRDEEIDDICSAIRRSGAKVRFVGLGVPTQESWLDDNLAKTGATVGMG
jgi:N-acetylglucosaminyldiphosphoundecaprenol N-acetyl-beta-D-mannosaminyltransferase